ncbi:hypothetical protein CEQ90_10495 [Lewinellaceae bacterium SD302]|nr:hypothetical protein CEQ90_10495 [Lewinellaceae bacterium SD302]
MSKDKEEKKEPTAGERLFDRAAAFVREKFHDELDPVYLFHNWAYANAIAEEVGKLAEKTEEVENDKIPYLKIAGLFYPVGYVRQRKNPQEASVTILQEFFDYQKPVRPDEVGRDSSADGENPADQGQATTELTEISDWIVAAADRPEEGPIEAQLLYDAANSWLGRKRYERRGELLRLERQALKGGKEIDPVVFGRELEEQMLKFDYLTDAGKKKYEGRRRKNVSSIHEDMFKLEQKVIKQKSGKNYGRGIDTMYRTAFRNHINLSRIADGKANMMISINTIILSIIIAVSGAGLGFFEELFFSNPLMLLPIITLLLSSLTAVIFAVFSARPKVTEYRIKKRKLIKSDEASLLYFGNFLKLEKQDFVGYMSNIKHDLDGLYDDLSRDLYDLGQVLHRKYLLLTISYNTFVGGLALSVLSFLIVYMINLF